MGKRKSIEKEFENIIKDLNGVLSENITADTFMYFYDRIFKLCDKIWECDIRMIEDFSGKVLEFAQNKNSKEKIITYKLFSYFWRKPEYLGKYKERVATLSH